MSAAVLFAGVKGNRHGAIADVKFVVEILEVILDRVLRNARACGNLEIGPAVGQHGEQLALSRRQPG